MPGRAPCWSRWPCPRSTWTGRRTPPGFGAAAPAPAVPSRPTASPAPSREPNGRTCWFGAELDPDGDQIWFRIDEDAIGRMPEKTPAARGDRLIDALIVWITPDRQLEPGINRFEVRVSEPGDTWIERLQW